MSQPDLFASEVESLSIGTFSKKAYLDYSMYVILDRALPFIGDGLKPVQRRIVFAMSELGLVQASKFKKSARTVGDVLGKFHPHGDSACYEAMVLMAQTFSTRYPYIDGQGNWGSPDDPKSFAAMRYTESRLTNYSALLLDELAYDTTRWVPNFDGTLKEPKYLPAKVPNILLNGASGIAVGMATDILPHNLNEVIDACVDLIDNPHALLEDIVKHIKGPDFPSKAQIITKPEDILSIYKTGQGSIRQRSTYKVNGNKIIIETLPYQASLVKIIEQIAAQVVSKRLPIITDIQDESDHTCAVRLVLTTKAKKNQMDDLMLHLFATTDLEKQYRANFNIIGLDGKPSLKNLLGILKEWLTFRVDVVEKRLNYQLDKVNARLLILAALFVVYNNLDEIIHIIRTEDHPKNILMQTFGFNDIQAEAILNTKLRHLAKLEEEKLLKEKLSLEKEKAIYEKHLSSKVNIKKLIKKELLSIKNEDTRNSEIVIKKPALSSKFDLALNKEPVTVVLSKLGWIRMAKGHDIVSSSMPFRPLDDYFCSVKTYSNETLYVYDSFGKFYNLSVNDLPSARGHGEPITAKLNMPQGSKALGMFNKDIVDIALVGNNGYGFIINTLPVVKTKLGLPALKLDESTDAVIPVSLQEFTNLAIITNQNNMLVIEASQIPIKTKSKGNKLITLDTNEFVIKVVGLKPEKGIKLNKNIPAEKLKKFMGNKGNKPKKLPFKII